jgi:hypothetical protein
MKLDEFSDIIDIDARLAALEAVAEVSKIADAGLTDAEGLAAVRGQFTAACQRHLDCYVRHLAVAAFNRAIASVCAELRSGEINASSEETDSDSSEFGLTPAGAARLLAARRSV